MNSIHRCVFVAVCFGVGLLALGNAGFAASKPGQPVPDRAVVKAVSGTATFAPGLGEQEAPLRVGDALRPGAILKTGPNSHVTLHLGKNQSAVRINADSTFVIQQLTYQETDQGLVTQTELEIKKGSLVGSVKKLSAASNYQVKTPNSSAGIRGTTFAVEASGNVHVVSGTVVVKVSVTLPNGTVVTKDVTVGEGQSLTFPASGVLNEAIINSLQATPTPASVTATLTPAVTQTTALTDVTVVETFEAASPAQGKNANQETGFKVDNPQIEVISK